MTTKPIIEVKDLKKSFGTLQVLKGINTEVQKGEVVVVIGPSGSGKSTFLRCLNLLETPTAGSIYVDGGDHRPQVRYQPAPAEDGHGVPAL